MTFSSENRIIASGQKLSRMLIKIMLRSNRVSWHIAFFSLFFCFFPIGDLQAKLESFHLKDFGGDQEFVGMSEVQKKAAEWLEIAESLAKAKGTEVNDEIILLVNEELKTEVIAYKSPDGRVRATDGHHKMKAAQLLLKEKGINQKKIEFRVDLKEDFSGKASDKNWAEYIEYRERHNPIYIPNRKNLSQAEIISYYKNLPTTLDDMRDLPMRSAIGALFDAASLKGTWFEPAIQFKVGEEYSKLGIIIKPGQEYSAETQHKIMKVLFVDEKGANIQKFILSQAKESNRKEVETLLREAKTIALGIRATQAGESGAHGVGGNFSKGQVSAAKGNQCYLSFSQLTRKIEGPISLPSSSKHHLELLMRAQEKSLAQLDITRMRGILKKIAEKGTLSGEDALFLKEARKSSLVFRSAVKLVGNDETREAMKPFRSFVSDLGGLNDKIKKWNFKGELPGSISKSATGLLELTAGNFKQSIAPKKLADFEAFHAKNLKWLKDTTHKEGLTIGEYHEIRKSIRDYKAMLELMAEHDPTPANIGASRFLADLSKRMGKEKDGFKIPTKKKKATPFLSRPTKIDERTTKDIDVFLSAMAAYAK